MRLFRFHVWNRVSFIERSMHVRVNFGIFSIAQLFFYFLLKNTIRCCIHNLLFNWNRNIRKIERWEWMWKWTKKNVMQKIRGTFVVVVLNCHYSVAKLVFKLAEMMNANLNECLNQTAYIYIYSNHIYWVWLKEVIWKWVAFIANSKTYFNGNCNQFTKETMCVCVYDYQEAQHWKQPNQQRTSFQRWKLNRKWIHVWIKPHNWWL